MIDEAAFVPVTFPAVGQHLEQERVACRRDIHAGGRCEPDGKAVL